MSRRGRFRLPFWRTMILSCMRIRPGTGYLYSFRGAALNLNTFGSSPISRRSKHEIRRRFAERSYNPFATPNPVASTAASTQTATATATPVIDTFLVQWRGEGDITHSRELRHLELECALMAASLEPSEPSSVSGLPTLAFTDALPSHTDDSFDPSSIQYVTCASEENPRLTPALLARAAERCATVRSLHLVAGCVDVVPNGAEEFRGYEKLARLGLRSGVLDDLLETHSNTADNDTDNDNPSSSSWCFRLRDYSIVRQQQQRASKGNTLPPNLHHTNDIQKKGKYHKYGKAMKSSLSRERASISHLKELMELIGDAHPVDLKKPDVCLYAMEGMRSLPPHPEDAKNDTTERIVLTREIAKGRMISAFAPNTRICVTTTPLPPVAAFTICNIALIRNEVVIRGSELHKSIHRRCNILDPYVGSASTLLAAAHLSPKCQTVGIELAHSGHVNFDHIIQDFDARNLTRPAALIRGDCRSKTVRDEARNSIRSGKHGEDYKYSAAFDVIVSDPPYGKRERINDDSTNTDNNNAPLVDLFTAIRQDLEAGTPLLNRGGRLVAYVPHLEVTDKKQTFEKNMTTMTLMDGLPSDGLIRDAGLRFVTMREQTLSSRLSRWLVIYDCIL